MTPLEAGLRLVQHAERLHRLRDEISFWRLVLAVHAYIRTSPWFGLRGCAA